MVSSMPSTNPTLEQRIDRLERETRWWKVSGTVAILGLCLVTFLGATPKPRSFTDIIGTRLIITDNLGRTMVEIGPDNLGPMALQFLNPATGHLDIRLGLFQDGAGLARGLNLIPTNVSPTEGQGVHLELRSNNYGRLDMENNTLNTRLSNNVDESPLQIFDLVTNFSISASTRPFQQGIPHRGLTLLDVNTAKTLKLMNDDGLPSIELGSLFGGIPPNAVWNNFGIVCTRIDFGCQLVGWIP